MTDKEKSLSLSVSRTKYPPANRIPHRFSAYLASKNSPTLLYAPEETDSIQPLSAFSGHSVFIVALTIDPSPEFERSFDVTLGHAAVTLTCFEHR